MRQEIKNQQSLDQYKDNGIGGGEGFIGSETDKNPQHIPNLSS